MICVVCGAASSTIRDMTAQQHGEWSRQLDDAYLRALALVQRVDWGTATASLDGIEVFAIPQPGDGTRVLKACGIVSAEPSQLFESVYWQTKEGQWCRFVVSLAWARLTPRHRQMGVGPGLPVRRSPHRGADGRGRPVWVGAAPVLQVGVAHVEPRGAQTAVQSLVGLCLFVFQIMCAYVFLCLLPTCSDYFFSR